MEGILNLNKVTSLSNEQCDTIINLSKNLQLIADISQSDIFIDCLLPEGNAAIVVAEANPTTTQSLYKNSVLGQIAYEEAEPGVLFSLKTGKPVIGSRGISQEYVVIQQDIVPITDSLGFTFAVLIKERDISSVIQTQQKVTKLMKNENSIEKKHAIQSIVIQEIHHRVKNNLQIISSLLRLQMRRSSSEDVAEVFRDSISRISSMAMIHDYLAQNGIEEVDVKFVIKQIADLFSSSIIPGQSIAVSTYGDSLFLPSNRATSVALIVNELIQNSIKHAFSCNKGKIDIYVNCRKQMATITVTDDGIGMNEEVISHEKSSLGLQLVELLVEEELQGILSFFISERGTKVSITFPVIDKVM
ncbi:sensor histidine kinase [Bacillus sp. 03113]|uniref:sensor histidine kinase n=1 Tax=Bacillus sp. 03113 TaxID=2578211 RepID=UPI0011418DDD|nr:sensor histidine kinase [Bacillus sp. 03113]